ncbi:unnamed protein product [Fraxinus pennsylvanica]|uniref:Uncharacterized protein n=1 Tax=Fraxinus pennsylvanica TaxID=56036 RepID=A0AAD2A161_9LAMI|nr:unnamed protein product [Fraxinus pennsylvanica]
MTPHEERLVLELHSKWGNRWSKIARKLPGRTDNEIKNYWRTHMRKKALEKKKNISPSSSSSSFSSNSPTVEFTPITENKHSFYNTGGRNVLANNIDKKSDYFESPNPPSNSANGGGQKWKMAEKSLMLHNGSLHAGPQSTAS